jgi:oxygen-independent coproporphyrinogen-3 oxidase
MQSADPHSLDLLERQHGYADVVQAVGWARRAGFDNLNLDLIFGLPYQDLKAWQRDLDLALALGPEHLSLYALTLEHGTPLAHWVGRGLLAEPDGDLAAEMYEWAGERLAQAGYTQYEISNWACSDARHNGTSSEPGSVLACRHNLQYWRNQPYLGLGAGAHGFAGGMRTANVLSPRAYARRCLAAGEAKPFPRTPATVSARPVDRAAEIGETMMMGLRLTQEGVSRTAFQQRFGLALEEVFDVEIQDLCGKGLLEWAGAGGDILRLTSQGRLLGNQVFMRFI